MAAVTGKKPHVLAVPLPAQGHIKPLMSLCRQIAKHGIKVTFAIAQSIHEKLVTAAKLSGEEEKDDDEKLVLTSVPDGLTAEDEPRLENFKKTMQVTLLDLIERINSSNPNEKISCVIGDLSFGWILEIAEKMGAEPVGFSPPSIASLASILHIPKLLEEGYLDTNGSLKKGDIISLSDDIPVWRKDQLTWSFPIDLDIQNVFFECLKDVDKAANAKWLLCNTCYELEPSACDLKPNLLPIGPLHLLDTNTPKSSSTSCNFYPEDASCLRWLDDKPAQSVIYVSFGTSAVISQQQFDELAMGLELSGRAFLWVVRPDLAYWSRPVYPDGFLERVSEFGKIVEWAPQDKVLAHPSIACFMSHCGWNSTLEGVSEGVPFLCWPFAVDQIHNESYICDKWEIGLRINSGESGVRSRHEIKKKIYMIFSKINLKEDVMKLKEICGKNVSEGGSSYKNLGTFIDHLRK